MCFYLSSFLYVSTLVPLSLHSKLSATRPTLSCLATQLLVPTILGISPTCRPARRPSPTSCPEWHVAFLPKKGGHPVQRPLASPQTSSRTIPLPDWICEKWARQASSSVLVVAQRRLASRFPLFTAARICLTMLNTPAESGVPIRASAVCALSCSQFCFHSWICLRFTFLASASLRRNTAATKGSSCSRAAASL